MLSNHFRHYSTLDQNRFRQFRGLDDHAYFALQISPKEYKECKIKKNSKKRKEKIVPF